MIKVVVGQHVCIDLKPWPLFFLWGDRAGVFTRYTSCLISGLALRNE